MISIVIPIFNEEETLSILYSRLIESSKDWNDEFEILLVDDGSFDNTPQILKELANKDPHIKVISLSRNFGHQPAISAGLKYSKGSTVVIMDGDLQDPPEEIINFINKWKEGYDVVYAIRTKRKEGLVKRISYKVFYRLFSALSEIPIPLDSGDFCLMDRKVVDTINNAMPEQIKFVRGLRAFAGFKQTGIKYERAKREFGYEKYTFKKLIKLAVEGILSFSTFPLKLAIYLGFIVSFFSLIIGLFFIAYRIFNLEIMGKYIGDSPGLTTVITGLFFLNGILFIILGIIGAYIGRIFFEVKRRPFYIVDNIYQRNN